jgi:hypothetical protein
MSMRRLSVNEPPRIDALFMTEIAPTLFKC